MSEFYRELVQRNDIVAVARELGLEVRGTRCRCFRPYAHAHGDRTPSLSFNRRTNTFRCWVCPDVWGNVVDLVVLARGCAREDAIAYLAARAGLPLPERRGGPPFPERRRVERHTGVALPAPDRPPAAPVSAEPPLPEERVDRIYRSFLQWCDRPSPRGYLTRRRGISVETLQRMRVVWLHDIASVEGALRDLYPEEELVASGLFNEWGLIFRGYPMVFPFLRRGQVCFLQGRRTDWREPKYLSVRRPIPCFYNHDLLETLAPGDPVVVSEGVIDTLTWLDHGVAAIGILGVGTLKAEWLEALRPFRVLLALDSDEPGVRAARSLHQRLAAAGQDVRIVTLPEGVKDVNDLFVKHADRLHALRFT